MPDQLNLQTKHAVEPRARPLVQGARSGQNGPIDAVVPDEDVILLSPCLAA